MRADPGGWLDLAVYWSSQKGVNALAAKDVLQTLFSKAEVKAAKARTADAARTSSAIVKLSPRTIDAAFAAGDLPLPWSLLASLGEDARSKTYAKSAKMVVRETMRRVRRNLERIVRRLGEQGYVFRYPDRVLEPLLADASKRLARIEKIVGPVPMALRAAYEEIGACDLQGTHPAWTHVACNLDPLVLVSSSVITEDIEDEGSEGDAIDVALSGDALTKAGFSGGTFDVRLPDASADPDGARRRWPAISGAR